MTDCASETKATSLIRNCSWGYKSEKTWDSLIATDKRNVRFCDDCDKEVYLCKTKPELADSVLLNRCVAFSSRLLKAVGARLDSNNEASRFSIGEVSQEYFFKLE